MKRFSARASAEFQRRFGMLPEHAAGLRSLRIVDGVLVGVYDGGPAGHDTEGGRWQTVCEVHSSICSHDTLELANGHAQEPKGWCEPCQEGDTE